MSGDHWWAKFCKIQTYSFFLTEEPSIKRVPDAVGNWIEQSQAAKIVDAMRDEIDELGEIIAMYEAAKCQTTNKQ